MLVEGQIFTDGFVVEEFEATVDWKTYDDVCISQGTMSC